MITSYKYQSYYPIRYLLKDYILGFIGILLTIGPLCLSLPTFNPFSIMLLFLGFLFGIFVFNTFMKHQLRVYWSDKYIVIKRYKNREISWKEIERLDLLYFPRKRGRDDGWMRLQIKFHSITLKFDSHLSNFDQLLIDSSTIAKQNGIMFNKITNKNLNKVNSISSNSL
tara:strand:+ start:76770 stop:77276 length:507 start_codon:yes stop_codon:yes gene_type:complete